MSGPKEELSAVFRNVLNQISEAAHGLVKAGNHVEAGIAFVAHALLHNFLTEGGEPEVVPPAAPPAETAPRCRHTFGDDGKCTVCGAVRKRAPKATTPPAGSAP